MAWGAVMLIQKDFLCKTGRREDTFQALKSKGLRKNYLPILVHLQDIKPHLLVNG